ncbi:hypothetical protein PFICI_06541 [Pestalotiopsis fici W106-1]|uniref:Zn(2)-C6 fungal-type domain-containing protein n=1 Tax=Pestalotiopsis fici (strain W106-1 / CGMCC3.15140) TaxID=1229662 RepID=W3X673_PESFW|nr:uncharacterized protein PFICI_06541 [Pestalotiopsis fici W106-1]ETS81539.1 hypothetical protein PFICI_06541 [Pestalotiopsis fici W106-1]
MESEPTTTSSLRETTPRRKSRKVRSGCRVCKRRKIKKPSCRNCIKHSATAACAAAAAPTAAGAVARPDVNLNSSSSPANGSLSHASPLSLDPIQLQLLHNYSTSTCYTLSSYVPLRTMWRISVPQLGFSTSFVMRAILALSALHMAHNTRTPSSAERYLSIARCEHDAALRTATELLRNVTAANCAPLFIFSIITFFYTMASPRPAAHMLLLDGSGVPDWLVLLRGLRHISEAAADELLAGPFAAAFAFGRMRLDQCQSLRSTLPPSSAWFSTVASVQLATLRQLVAVAVAESQTLLTLYLDTIDTLEMCFAKAQNRLPTMDLRTLDANDSSTTSDAKETTLVLAWPYLASNEYIEMLGQRQGVAMVILAHYCVLLQSLNGCWWMQGWPSYLIENIWQALDAQHRLWIQWPMEEVGWHPGDLSATRETLTETSI